LHRAIGALEFPEERERTRKFLPANAGKPWTNQEDALICDELRRGLSFEQIAQSHNRTSGSIISRLVRLGKISAGPQPARLPNQHESSQHSRGSVGVDPRRRHEHVVHWTARNISTRYAAAACSST